MTTTVVAARTPMLDSRPRSPGQQVGEWNSSNALSTANPQSATLPSQASPRSSVDRAVVS